MLDSLREELDQQDRHIEVLRAVTENEPIGIVTITDKTGYPHHRVRQSLRIFEEEDIIEPTPQGAATTPAAAKFPDTYNDHLEAIIDRLTQLKTDSPPNP